MNTNELHPDAIKALLVDDEIDAQNIVRDLLKVTPDIELVGIGSNGQEALALCEELHPDILLLDIMMPIMGGFEAAGLVKERFPKVKILVLSSINDHESVQAMLGKRVNGYVDKSVLVKTLAASIRAAHSGAVIFSPDVFASHLNGDWMVSQVRDFGLTQREQEILKLMKAGLNMPEIATELEIGKTTVKTHIEKIIKRFGVETRAEALVFAAENYLP